MDARAIQAALADPFPPAVVGWKAQATSRDGKKALAVGFIDARDVMDRLDAAVGVDGWQDEYTPLADGACLCTLRVKIGDTWIAKQDVGGASDQPDKGDKAKAAHSDALKRAAVKFGVGRYLYSLPAAWCDYDATKKQLTQTPQLPAWALPGGSGRPHLARPVYPSILAELKAATGPDALRNAFGKLFKANERKEVTDAEYAEGERVKNELKARFSQPAKA